MSKSSFLDPAVQQYLVRHTTTGDALLRRLVEETAQLTGERAQQQIPPEQGVLLQLLCQVSAARRVLELGTFTGYSSTCLARGLAPGGRLLTCDVSEEWTDVARRYWAEAGVDDRIELHLLPAGEFLRGLPDEPSFDLAFVDADKEHYLENYAQLLPRMRPGALLVFDNVLWGGRVLDRADPHPWTAPIAAFNDAVAADDRVDVVMLPFADGLTLLRKREDGTR